MRLFELVKYRVRGSKLLLVHTQKSKNIPIFTIYRNVWVIKPPIDKGEKNLHGKVKKSLDVLSVCYCFEFGVMAAKVSPRVNQRDVRLDFSNILIIWKIQRDMWVSAFWSSMFDIFHNKTRSSKKKKIWWHNIWMKMKKKQSSHVSLISGFSSTLICTSLYYVLT